MASELLSSAIGAGGGFVTKFMSGAQQVASGASGDVLTLTPPSGQKVEITALGALTSDCLDMTITVGGVDVVTASAILFSPDTTGGGVSVTLAPSTNVSAPSASIRGGTNDVIVLTRVTGTTNSTIIYQYQFGV